MRVAVIGSGPAGLACAKALIRRGLSPTLLDVGETLPPHKQAVVDRMSRLDPAQWSEADRDAAMANATIAERVPKKLVFGSDFHFARERAFNPLRADDDLPSNTFARGGYSVAWGAAALPAHDDDLAGWPLKRADLESSYRRMLADFPMSAAHDELERAFPLFKDAVSPLPLSTDAQSFLVDFRKATETEPDGSAVAGQARLLVDNDLCRRCGLCLSGCVYGAIASLAPEVERLAKAGAIQYQPSCFVLSVTERDGAAEVTFERIATGDRETLTFDHVFIAAGAIQSTRIVLASLKAFDRTVRMKDSQKFILPLLRRKRHPLAWPDNIALSSIFVDYKASDLSDHWIHAQISSVNDYVLRRLGVSLWRGGWRRTVLAPLYERMMIAWCGLHSDHSSEIDITLKASNGGAEPVLHLTAATNAGAARAAHVAARRFARLAAKSGTLAVTPALVLGSPGGGNHFGGTLPMRERPAADLDTDRLGRLQGWRRIHVVDGAILPSIPATTLALVQMATADHIAMSVEFG